MDRVSFRAIKILALKAADQPDWEDWYRRICRWYSREFSTPLPQVMQMAEQEILQTYFEDKYEQMATSGDETVRKEYENLKETVGLDEVQVVDQEQEEQDQEDAWAQEMIDQVKKDWKNKEESKLEESGNSPAIDPNLINSEESFSLPGEDSITQDEELDGRE